MTRMFAVTGRIEAGACCLSYVRHHFLLENGDLAADGSKTSLQRMQRNLANYMDGWVAIGAWLLGDYRLADSVCRFLLSQQSAAHGGVLTGPQRWSGKPRYDLATAASCGRAFLIVGYRDAAASAADFLVELGGGQDGAGGWHERPR